MEDENETLFEGLIEIARAINRLGNADAATSMGGLEALGKMIKEGDERIATSISDVAEALLEVASALSNEDINLAWKESKRTV